MSRQAKYYIYRNLHKGKAFSIRYRGRVILATDDTIMVCDPTFVVSKKGWERTRTDRRRNVHAFVVTDDYIVQKQHLNDAGWDPATSLNEVWYNPFKCDTPTFMERNRKTDVSKPIKRADVALLMNGKAWV